MINADSDTQSRTKPKGIRIEGIIMVILGVVFFNVPLTYFKVRDIERKLDHLILVHAKSSFEPHNANARLLPYFQGGQMVGMKLISTENSDLCKSHGLEDGDIIESVGGIKVTHTTVLSDVCEAKAGTRLKIMREGVAHELTSTSVPKVE